MRTLLSADFIVVVTISYARETIRPHRPEAEPAESQRSQAVRLPFTHMSSYHTPSSSILLIDAVHVLKRKFRGTTVS